MARRLDTDGYTHDEVAAVVSARTAWKPRLRMKVTDRFGNPVDDLDPQIFECRIAFDGARRITGSLVVEMDPIEELRNKPFQYRFLPELGFGPMRDGGTAWLPYGSYPWTAPRRVIRRVGRGVNVERWQVAMGDDNHILGLAGPGLVNFVCSQDSLGWEGIVRALARAGETDFDAVEPSDETLGETLSWNVRVGPRAWRTLSAAQHARAVRLWKRTIALLAQARKNKKNNVAPDPPRPTRRIPRDPEEQGMRWLDILTVLHDLLGYLVPHRNLDGEYVARPAYDPSIVAPTINYTADRDSIIIAEPEIEPDLTGLANVIYVNAKDGKLVNPGTVTGVARLGDLIPTHPMAPQQCGIEIEDSLNASSSMSQGAADALALRELVDSLLGWERVLITVAIDPAHEAFEIPTLFIPNDDEFSTAQVLIEQGWEIDATRGTMRLDCARSYRAFE